MVLILTFNLINRRKSIYLNQNLTPTNILTDNAYIK